MSLRFRSPAGLIELSDGVLETFNRHRQLKFWAREAGGQLFYREVNGKVCIERATEPGRGDQRSRFSFWPARRKEQREINQKFEKGLHYIGDWHTHPEDLPTPSWDDTSKMTEIFERSEHVLTGMLMVIVGRRTTPDGIWCGFVGKFGVHRLGPDLD